MTMERYSFYSKFLILMLLFSSTGCSSTNVQKTLGIQKPAPNEFAVNPHPPLSVPPDFSLRPPHSGQETTSDMVFSLDNLSPAEQAFLEKANASKEHHLIKHQLDEKFLQEEEENKSFWEKISIKPDPTQEVINAPLEKQRLNDTISSGKPVNSGEVPVKSKQTEGLLNQLLNTGK